MFFCWPSKVSRVTDPDNFVLVGVPPKDIIGLVAEALSKANHDVDAYFKRACSVTGEWVYTPDNTRLVVDRIQPQCEGASKTLCLFCQRWLAHCNVRVVFC